MASSKQLLIQPGEKTPYSALNERQKNYVLARMTGMIPTHAARAIGVTKNPNQAAQNFEKSPRIRAALVWLAKQDRPDLNRDAVLDGFMDAVRSAGTSMELTAAWREIGKLLGVYAPDELKITHEDITTARLKQMSDRDLLHYMGKGEFKRDVEKVYDAEFEVLSTAVEDLVPMQIAAPDSALSTKD